MDDSNAAAALPDPTSVADGEFAKSQETRKRILEAMMKLLADQGYAALSTPAIAKASGLSRTALLYHFSSRSSLLEAVVRYVMRRRIELHEEMIADMPRGQRFRDMAVDAGWAQLQSVEFKAYCELSVAARTDNELNRVFTSTLEAFDRARRDIALQLAEPSVAQSPVFDLRRDIHRLILEGIATGEGFSIDAEKRAAELFAFVKLIWSDDGEAFLKQAQQQAVDRP